MYSIDNILVTTDFSDFSTAALDYAISLADLHVANIHLLHVIDEHPVHGRRKQGKHGRTAAKSAEETAGQTMQQFVYEMVNEYVNVKQVIRIGHPAEEIIRYAAEEHIDLIVMATHGRTGLAHMLIGSIAEKVVRSSAVPVLTVRPTAVLERLITESDIAKDLHIGVEG